MYQSLQDIQAEKERLHKAISDKEDEIGAIWDGMFHENKDPLMMTPTQRLLKHANTFVGVLDGAIFGWKLYRKFWKKKLLF